jgi:hypothetical protein
MTAGEPVQAKLRVDEVSRILDGDKRFYTIKFSNSEKRPDYTDNYEGLFTYVDVDGLLEVNQGDVLTLVFAEEFPVPTETKTTRTRTSQVER